MLEKSKSCVMCGKTAITLYIEFDAWVCSSDCADALMLTLAIPESQIQSSKSAASDVAQQMAASQAKMDAIRTAQYKR